MPTSDRRYSRSLIGLLLALVGSACMLYYHLVLFMPHVRQATQAKHLAGEYSVGNDFYPIWLTSRQWLRERMDPYGPELTRQIQIGVLGRTLESRTPSDPPADYRRFAYPAYTDLLLWPVAEIPFPTLRLPWIALLATLLVTSVVFLARTLEWRLSALSLGIVLLLTLFSYQELEGLYAGQLGLVVGFLVAASFLALARNRFVLAGALLAVATIKPQMVLLAVLYLLLWSAYDWRHRGRFCVAFFATLFLLIASSLMVWPGWIRSWISVIAGYPSYSTPPLASELLGATLRSHVGTLVIALLLIAAMGLALRARAATLGSYEFWLTVSLLLALTTITLVPGQSVCDHIILLPGIFLLAGRDESRPRTMAARALLMMGAALVVWPWLAAMGLLAIRPFVSPEVFYSKAVFALPLRTAAAFPFVVVAGLTLLMRRTRTDVKKTALTV